VNYFLVALAVSLSPLLGYATSRFAKEELKPGKKWFVFAKKALFTVIAAIFLFAHKREIWHMTAGLLVLFAYLAFEHHRARWAVWAALGAAYALTAQTPLAFLLSACIFLYGLLAGAVLAGIRKPRGAFAAGALFFAAAAVLSHLS
jgi:hypothetical protein